MIPHTFSAPYTPQDNFVRPDDLQPGDWITVRVTGRSRKERYLQKFQVLEVRGRVLDVITETGKRSACMVYDVRKAWRTKK